MNKRSVFSLLMLLLATQVMGQHVITDFSPRSGNVGTAVTITGTGFGGTTADYVVYFGPVKASIVSVTATALEVTVPVGASYTPITVIKPSTGRAVQTASPFDVTMGAGNGREFGSGNFVAGTPFLFSNGAMSGITFGDIDGDQKADILVSNENVDKVYVYQNTSVPGTLASGSFANPFSLPCTAARSVALADIDGDGRLDIVTARYGADKLSIFRNRSTGPGALTAASFENEVEFTTGQRPATVTVRDVDGDGKLDIAVANAWDINVSVFRNTSTPGVINTGSLAARQNFSTPGANAMTLSDMDGDGMPDMIVGNFGSQNVSFLLNTSSSGAISFGTPVNKAVGDAVYDVQTGDFDGDGKQDVVIGRDGGVISLMRNTSTTGNISTDTRVDLSTGGKPNFTAVGDLDGDGKPDIAVANWPLQRISVFKNYISSPGTFTSSSFSGNIELNRQYTWQGLTIADADNDRKPDIVAIIDNISFFHSLMDYEAATPSGLHTFAGDQQNVVLWTASTEEEMSAYKVYGGTSPNPTTLLGTAYAPAISFLHTGLTNNTTYYYRITAVDALGNESDPTADVTGIPIAATVSVPTITSLLPVFAHAGSSVTITGTNFNTTASQNSVHFGSTPAVVTAASATQLTVTVPSGAPYQSVTVTNLTNGRSASASKPFDVKLSGGLGIDFTTGSFASTADWSGNLVTETAIGDLDDDGKPDLLMSINGSLLLYRNISASGNLTESAFSSPVVLSHNVGGVSATQLSIDDIDGDGKPDIVASVEGYYYGFFVYRNLTTGNGLSANSFQRINVGAYQGPIADPNNFSRAVAVADIDLDGRKDVVVADEYYANKVYLYRNTSLPGAVTFTAQVIGGFSVAQRSIALNDLDGDGKPELITASDSETFLSVFRNISSPGSITAASFDTRVTVNIAAPVVQRGLVVADMDQDGKSDLVMASETGKIVSLCRNITSAGNITAASFTRTDISTGSLEPDKVAVADLDGDGKPDMVVPIADHNGTPGYLAIYRNKSTPGSLTAASFQERQDVAGRTKSGAVAVGDLNGDGAPDIALSQWGWTEFFIYKNMMDFTPPTASAPRAVSGDAKNLVSWEASPEEDVVSYKLFGGTSPNPATLLTTINAPATYYAHTGLTNGTTYYYRIIAVDESGNESDPTSDVSSIPAARIVPVITQVTPAKGNPGTTITITGTHFGTTTANNIVFFGAAKASVVSASATQLTVTVPVGATYAAVSVLNTTTGLTGSSAAFFAPTFGNERNIDLRNESLGERVDIAAANFADVVAGDIDGDGKQDMIGLNRADGNESIMLFRNTATPGTVDGSTFASPVSMSIGPDPRSVVLADLDNDGKLDLIVSNYTDGIVSVFRNTATTGGFSSGTFASTVNLTADDGPSSLAIADIDGDGKRDIVVASNEMVSIFRNIGSTGTITTGSFAARVDFDAAPERVNLSDIDGDGMVDLLISEPGNNRFAMYRNVASPGSFTTSSFMSPAYFDGNYSQHIATADVDRDGKFDVAVSQHLSNAYIHRNTASLGNITPGSLGAGLEFANGDNLQDVLFGDIDGDGNQDFIAAISDNSAGISIRRVVANTGTIDYNSFGDQLWIDVDNSGDEFIGGMTFSDVDGDGQQDLLMATSLNISVYRNTVDPQAPAAPQLLSVTPGDGSATLQIATPTDNDVVSYQVRAVLASDPEGEPYSENIDAGQPLSMQRLNNGVSFIFTVYARDGYGNFSPVSNSVTATPAPPPSPIITEVAPLSVVAGKSVTLTGENFNATPANNLVYFGVTKATVTSASATELKVTVPVGAAYGPVSVLNTELSRAGWSRQPFAARVGAGLGQDLTTSAFEMTTTPQSGNSDFSMSMALGDIDGDGKPELVVANYNYSTMSVYRNISASGSTTADSFAGPVDFNTELYSSKVEIADLNGDGKNDIVVANENSGALSIFRNTASAGTIDGDSFAPVESMMVNSAVLCIADVDLDGKPDFITSDWNDGSIVIRRNECQPAGDINFETFSSPVAVAPNYCMSLAAGDLDGDGKPEIVGADYDNRKILVLHNMAARGNISSAAFEEPVAIALADRPYTVAIADLDQDGKSDLVTGNQTNKIAIFRNTSSAGSIDAGSFTAGVDLLIGPSNWDSSIFAVNDLDGDGRPDIVSVEGNNSKIVAFRNISAPGSITTDSFKPAFNFTSGNNEYPYAIVLGDVDGDGKSDMVVPNASSVTLAIFHNAMDLAAPAMPVNLSAVAGENDIVLTWNANTDINLASYKVYGGTTPEPTTLLTTVDAPATSYTHTGVTKGVIYYYRIAAVKTVGYESEKTADAQAVIRVTSTIIFPALSGVAYGIADFAPGATSTNTTTPVLYASSNTAVATIVNGKIHVTGVGTTAITASQPQDELHLAAADVTRQLVVSKAGQVITFNALADKKSGDAAFAAAATSTSGLAVVFSSTTSELVSITGNQITLLKPGRVNITATQPGDDRYTAATPVTQSFCIVPAWPAVTLNLANPETPVLTSTSASGNQWYLNGTAISGATASSYTAAGQGIYTVKVTADDCVSEISAGVPVIVTETLPAEAVTMLQVYPNPAAEKISISIPGKGVKRVMITSQEGKVVYSSEIAGKEVTVDVSNYAGGAYVVSATAQHRTEVARFVKK